MSDMFDFEEEQPKRQNGLWIVSGTLFTVILVLNIWSDEEQGPYVIQADDDSGMFEAVSVVDRSERKIQWPTMQFEDVLEANPFLMTSNLADALKNEDDRESEAVSVPKTAVNADQNVSLERIEPKQLDASVWPVRFVFQGPRGAAAMIGDTVYYEGDELDGMRIIRIALNGVTLCPLPTRVPAALP